MDNANKKMYKIQGGEIRVHQNHRIVRKNKSQGFKKYQWNFSMSTLWICLTDLCNFTNKVFWEYHQINRLIRLICAFLAATNMI